MARLTAGLVAGAMTVVLAGCGGGGASGPPCDDAAFRDQTEELYVAIATAQNAQTPGAPPTVVADLKRGAEVLRVYLEAHPACDEELRALAETELEAVGKLDAAVTSLEAGDDAGPGLADAIRALGEAERALR